MILLADVKDWLKTVFEADHYYAGKLDGKRLHRNQQVIDIWKGYKKKW